jgi:peptidoglycan/LPS O-acetylase OafA/YrhL
MRTPSVAGPAVDPKLGCFEALRGLCAVTVIVNHIIMCFWPAFLCRELYALDQSPWWLRTLNRLPSKFVEWNGQVAIAIFFILSGFVLSLAFFHKGSASVLASAAVRRYPRLMIPGAASIILSLVLLATGAICNQAAVHHLNELHGFTQAMEPNAEPASYHWLARFYLDMSPDIFNSLREAVYGAFIGPAMYNQVLWTMQYELVGSYLVYAFLALFGSLRNRWLLYGAGAGLLVLGERYYLLDFMLGMALCDVWVRNPRSWRNSLSLAQAFGLIGAAVFLVHWRPMAGLLVVGATAASPRLRQMLEAGWLVFLGRVSFGLYLVHMPILCSVGCGLYLFLCRDLGWHFTVASSIAALAAGVTALVVGWVFYLVVDRFAIVFSQRFDIWLFRVNDNRERTPLEKTNAAVARAA